MGICVPPSECPLRPRLVPRQPCLSRCPQLPACDWPPTACSISAWRVSGRANEPLDHSWWIQRPPRGPGPAHTIPGTLFPVHGQKEEPRAHSQLFSLFSKITAWCPEKKKANYGAASTGAEHRHPGDPAVLTGTHQQHTQRWAEGTPSTLPAALLM